MARPFLFTASDDAHGLELWITDGTAAGTKLVKDLYAGTTGSSPTGFTPTGDGRFLFAAIDPAARDGLWITDGTASGTKLVKDLNASNDTFGSPQAITPLGNGTFLFSGYDETHGRELWRTDGTAGGTVLVKDIFPGTDAGNPPYSGPQPNNGLGVGSFMPLGNGKAVFAAFDSTYNSELWITDGTTAGTTLLKDINPATLASTGEPLGSSPSYFTKLPNGRVVFKAYDNDHGDQLWVTDGTASGTRVVKDIDWSRTATLGGEAPGIVMRNGKLLLPVTVNSKDMQIWTTDGTGAGTVLLKQFTSSNDIASPRQFRALDDGRVLFNADDGTHGSELWITDGTTAGTTLVKDINPGKPGAGVTVGASSVTPIGNGKALFAATDGTTGIELWITDGTAAGTKLVKDINPNGGDSRPQSFTDLGNGQFLFAADDGVHGSELWITDGTSAGTRFFADLNPGANGSSAKLFTPIGDASDTGAAPTNLTLSASTAAEFAKAGTTVGTLKVADPDAGDSFTYKLLDDAGGRFALSGTVLKVKNGLALDYEQARTDTVTVEVTDAQGHSLTKTLAITVKDVNPERVTGSAGADTLVGGAGADQFSGLGGNDTLRGGAGNDLIDGGLGTDVLAGGAGQDSFLFASALSVSNLDHVTDFRAADDTIRLENAVFKALEAGALDADAFALIGAKTAVVDADARILYEKASGTLYYDPNGGTASGRVAFAVLDNHTSLTFQDFLVT